MINYQGQYQLSEGGFTDNGIVKNTSGVPYVGNKKLYIRDAICNVQMSGSYRENARTITTVGGAWETQCQETDAYLWLINASSEPQTITLPVCADTNLGRSFTIALDTTSSAYDVYVAPQATDTIDGGTSPSVLYASTSPDICSAFIYHYMAPTIIRTEPEGCGRQQE